MQVSFLELFLLATPFLFRFIDRHLYPPHNKRNQPVLQPDCPLIIDTISGGTDLHMFLQAQSGTYRSIYIANAIRRMLNYVFA